MNEIKFYILEEWNNEKFVVLIVNMVVFGFYFLIGIIGNIIVIYIYNFWMKGFWDDWYFIFYFVVMDFCVCGVGVGYVIVLNMLLFWF